MDRWLQSLATAAIALGLLSFGRSVFVPLAVAVLLAVVLAPLVRRLERFGLGRFALGRVGAVLIVCAGLASVFVGVGWLVGMEGRELGARLPEYRRVFIAKLRDLREPLVSLERAAREVRDAAAPVGQPAPAKVEVVGGMGGDSQLFGVIGSWAGSLASLLATAGLVLVILVFLLIEREDLRNRLLRVAGPANLRRATSTLGDATERVTRYLRALALVNFGHGAIVAIGLWVIGLPGALLFGLLSAVLRFIPYFGPWVAAAAPIALSVAVFETWTLPLLVVSLFAVIELVSNNVFEPLFIGSRVGLSPFGVILSAIFWAWLWGPIGLVLATPLTAALVVAGRHIPRLAPLSILLSDGEPLSPAQRLYQRLLAHDVDEATDLVEECAESTGSLAAWDDVVLPALCLLDRDRQARSLDSDQLECARETFEVLLAELPEPKEFPAEANRVQCLPARGWSDELACRALVRFVESSGIPAAAPGHRLVSEMADLVAAANAPAVCIFALDSVHGGALRHLLLRVRERCPQVPVIVGVCGDDAWISSVRQRLGADPRVYVVNGIAEAQERLQGVSGA